MEIETILWYAQAAFNLLVAVVFLLHQRRVVEQYKKDVAGRSTNAG